MRMKKNHPSHSLKRILGPYSHIWERAGGKKYVQKKIHANTLSQSGLRIHVNSTNLLILFS